MSDIDEKRGPGRPPLRTPIREQAAAAQAAPERERRRRRPMTMDEFEIPAELVPENESWEWKRMEVAGKDDPFYIQGMRENGWEPVDAKKCPGMVPPGYKGPVMKKGMLLMERPKELTLEALKEQKMIADAQVGTRLQFLAEAPTGTAPRAIHRDTAPNIKRSHAPIDS